MKALIAAGLLILALGHASAGDRPPDIVDAARFVPGLALDVRYATADNFLGRAVAGYRAAKCLLTRRAAEALQRVQEELRPRGLGLKVYDCYRPQAAVDDFVRWGRDPADARMKGAYYPDVDKRHLFRDGYIAARSSHSRASTVDVTLVPLEPRAGADAAPPLPRAACARGDAGSLDMGTGFDCFGPRSHTDSGGITPEQRQNRALLRSLMARHGFVNLPEEWWHYTLSEEPYPDTYFDFPVE